MDSSCFQTGVLFNGAILCRGMAAVQATGLYPRDGAHNILQERTTQGHTLIDCIPT